MASTFSFTLVSLEEVKRSIESLELKKVAHKEDIHTNILEQNSDFFMVHVEKDINVSISALKFPYDLKEAHIILSNEMYRPISVHLNISKVYERCLYDQISKYCRTRFS